MSDKEKLFLVLKENLRVFDEVCKKNNLTYYVMYGTLIGAVRHKGFIPWDDDVDVCMPRKDYNRLMELGNTIFDEPYFLQNPLTDKGYQKTFMRLRNSNTTEIPIKDVAFDRNHGVFLDIFPFDVVPDNKKERDRFMKRLKFEANLLYFAGKVECKIGTLGLSKKMKMVYYLLLPLCKAKIITREKVYNLNTSFPNTSRL